MSKSRETEQDPTKCTLAGVELPMQKHLRRYPGEENALIQVFHGLMGIKKKNGRENWSVALKVSS